MPKQVIVIGAGIAGLASAVRLRISGYNVTVIEANDYVGGKLTEIRSDGYRFDAGPSLFTMPQYVDELFTRAGKNPRDYFDYHRLDTICKYFWDDGITLSTYSDQDRTATEIAEQLNEDSRSVKAHLADSKLKHDLTARTFLKNSLHKIKSWLHPSTIKSLLQLHRLDLFSTMHQVNEHRFRNPKTVQLFDRYATYNGSNPYKTPGLLNIIPHYEYGFGAYYPRGGMYSITKAVHQLACDIGVQFRMKEKVLSIDCKNRSVHRIRTDKEILAADLVVSNMDVYYTYKFLLRNEKKAQQIKKQERSSSALIFYWGVRGQFPKLHLHNIFFSNDYKAEFDAISRGEVYHDPTIYVNISSKMTTDHALPGTENWFTMINVPFADGQDWAIITAEARKNIRSKLSRVLGVSMSEIVEYEDVLDPLLIDTRTSSHTGSLYGTSSNSKWAAFMRHPNFTNSIDGLYFCGGSVHPGGGIPLCFLSAKIVNDLIQTKYTN